MNDLLLLLTVEFNDSLRNEFGLLANTKASENLSDSLECAAMPGNDSRLVLFSSAWNVASERMPIHWVGWAYVEGALA